jgi:cyclopropane fatty-acyl-phospholipid synthase-like methyltransferase
MRTLLYKLFLFLLIGCNSQPENLEKNRDKSHKQMHTHEEHSEHSTANDHMNKSSVEELVERFESPERDAYQKPDEVLNYLGDIQGKTIMDIGAGSGYFSVKLAEKGARVIAADVSDEFQEVIKKRIRENQIPNIELRKIPYDSPNLKEGEADIVFIVNTYHHIESRVDYFEKVKNGTKSGGALVIIDFFKVETPVGPPVNHKLAMDVVINELKSAGYSAFDVNVDLLPYQYIIRAQ